MKKGKVRKVGNSLGLTLPQDYVRALDLQDGDEISLRISGQSLIIDRFDSQLLEQMQAYHSELLKFKHTFKSLE
jgi:putative addiction module antidote